MGKPKRRVRADISEFGEHWGLAQAQRPEALPTALERHSGEGGGKARNWRPRKRWGRLALILYLFIYLIIY